MQGDIVQRAWVCDTHTLSAACAGCWAPPARRRLQLSGRRDGMSEVRMCASRQQGLIRCWLRVRPTALRASISPQAHQAWWPSWWHSHTPRDGAPIASLAPPAAVGDLAPAGSPPAGCQPSQDTSWRRCYACLRVCWRQTDVKSRESMPTPCAATPGVTPADQLAPCAAKSLCKTLRCGTWHWHLHLLTSGQYFSCQSIGCRHQVW